MLTLKEKKRLTIERLTVTTSPTAKPGKKSELYLKSIRYIMLYSMHQYSIVNENNQ